MKKKMVLMLALIMAFVLFGAACGSGNNKKEEEPPTQEEETASQEEAGADSKEESQEEGSSTQESQAESAESEAGSQGENQAASDIGNPDGVSFVVRLEGEPTGWNPNTKGDDNLYLIAQNIYLRLCALDSTKSSLVGEAAKSWEYNSDATELTFHLKTGFTWTDGTPLTSADVKYTFETIKNNPRYLFAGNMENVKEIEAVDNQTVVFRFESPDASFDKMLGWYGTFILPHSALGDAENWNGEVSWNSLVTCGPFVIGDVKKGESITLVPNSKYPDPGKVNKLVFAIIPDDGEAAEALKRGEIDYMEDLPEQYFSQIEARDDLVMADDIYPSPMRLVFNLGNEYLEDVGLRRAIAMCVDRDSIHKKVYGGKTMSPETTMYSSAVSWAANTQDLAPKYDIEIAKGFLKTKGYAPDKEGNFIPEGILSIAVPREGKYAQVAEMIAESLNSAGIPCTVEVYSYSQWKKKVSSMDFTMGIESGFMGPDPAAMAARYSTGGGGNTGHYSNEEVDALFIEGLATGNEAQRAKIYKEVQKTLSMDLPAVPILGYSTKNVYNKGFKNMPCNGAGKWSWGDFSRVEVL